MPRVAVGDSSRMSLRIRAEADHTKLSARDSLRVLDLLENPPKPNARLLAAAKALPLRS
jgi:uncharacterized protein (DUF1778 family)